MANYSIIFLDIETLPGDQRPIASELKPPVNYSKPETIAKWQEENAEDLYRKQALSSLEGKILCVCAACGDEEPVVFCGEEQDILNDLAEWMQTKPVITYIVGHNIKNFDALFLFHKAIKYNNKYIKSMFNGERRDVLRDTMTMLDGPSYKLMISLNKACKLIGIEGKADDIDGSKVYDYYLAGKLLEIYKYCCDDVRKVRDLYNRIIE